MSNQINPYERYNADHNLPGRDPRQIVAFAAAAVVFILPLLPVPEFYITQLNYIGIDALVVLGLVLLTGVAGLTSFGQAAFMGVGAYSTAYVTTALGWSPWVGLLLAITLTAAVALILGLVTLRMSGHNLPLATIAWCVALYFVFGNIDALGRYDGIVNIPPVTIGGTSLESGRQFYYLIWIIVGLAALASSRLLNSRTGRVLRAINTERGGGSTMPEAMGASTFRHKLFVFIIAAVYAGIAGWLFAHIQRTVNPSPFSIGESLEYLFMAVLGGVGFIWGAFVGAAVTTVLDDVLQDWLPHLLGGSGNYEIIIFGVLLVAVLKLSPGGIWAFVAARLRSRRSGIDIEDASTLAPRQKVRPDGPILELRGISKRFGGLVAVNDVSFSISRGEIVGLIGPNGAGKSTTFNLISGVAKPSAGEVLFVGKRVDGVPSRGIARMGLSRTFQHVKLDPNMSVMENVALGCFLRTKSGPLRSMAGLDRAEEKAARAEACRQLDRVGLSDSLHMKAGDLSLGKQRLVEIARALATDPTLLLLDEPAAGLRHAEKQALAKVLTQLRTDGLSLLLVEHDIGFVMKLVDRIVVMEFGTKLMEGLPEEVRASPVVRAAYLGVEHS